MAKATPYSESVTNGTHRPVVRDLCQTEPDWSTAQLFEDKEEATNLEQITGGVLLRLSVRYLEGALHLGQTAALIVILPRY